MQNTPKKKLGFLQRLLLSNRAKEQNSYESLTDSANLSQVLKEVERSPESQTGALSQNTDLFLQVYKRLEVAAKQEYGLRDDESAFYYLENRRKEFRSYRTLLHLSREIRNLIQHNQKYQGKYPVEVAPEIIIGLKACVDIIEKPIRASKIAIPTQKLLCVSLDAEVYPSYLEMLQRGFNHAPVLEQGKVVGVFSTDTIGQLFMESPEVNLEKLKFSDEKIAKYLPIEAHKTEQFGFVRKTLLYNDINELFEKAYAQGKHFCMFFVTENGNEREKILGLITSADMVGYDENAR